MDEPITHEQWSRMMEMLEDLAEAIRVLSPALTQLADAAGGFSRMQAGRTPPPVQSLSPAHAGPCTCDRRDGLRTFCDGACATPRPPGNRDRPQTSRCATPCGQCLTHECMAALCGDGYLARVTGGADLIDAPVPEPDGPWAWPSQRERPTEAELAEAALSEFSRDVPRETNPITLFTGLQLGGAGAAVDDAAAGIIAAAADVPRETGRYQFAMPGTRDIYYGLTSAQFDELLTGGSPERQAELLRSYGRVVPRRSICSCGAAEGEPHRSPDVPHEPPRFDQGPSGAGR
jgi:hypothetical protein